MFRIPLLLFVALMLAGCARSEERVIIVKQNQFFRCESDQLIRKKIVNLVNHARSQRRRCGSRNCPGVRGVKWNPRLTAAALNHSKDMARNNFFSHSGTNHSTVAVRVDSAGYAWRSVGENIYAGKQTTDEVVAGWLTSAGHCRNIMSSRFTEIGAACISNPDSEYGTYWTLVLAAPQ
jgi:uncharacterized protein YkwD